MAKKRICVLAAQVDESTQNRFLKSFIKTAYSYDYDVCIFSMYLKYQESTYREVGESNIYNLVNYALFDAVVILQDTIQTPGVVEQIHQRLHKEFDGLVVVIDKEDDYYPVIMIDHVTPIVKIVDHLIDVHGYKDIFFLNGRKGHIHSKQRLEGYMTSMKNHGLTVTDDMVYYGTYWYDSGDYMVDLLMKGKEKLPEAIVCANDCMAIGVCTAFEKYGIKVPEDIVVVGYDSIEDGRMSPVPITSAEIPANSCGEYTAHYIHAKLNNQEVADFKTDIKLMIGGTCRCCDWKNENYTPRRTMWKTDLSAASFYSCYNNLSDDLLDQNSVESFFNTVFQYSYQIRPFKHFYICMNDYWKNPEILSGDEALRYGYTEKMYRILKCDDDETGSSIYFNESFDSKDLLPDLFEERDYPTTFIFTPIHYQDRCFGYAVLNYGEEVNLYEEVFRVWMKTVMRGFEAFIRKESYAQLVRQYESRQIRDELTKLYNYRGFIEASNQLINISKGDEKEILISAFDIKNLKELNATYGRDAGDRLLLEIAKTIKGLLLPIEIAMRMSNDEFVVASLVSVGDYYRSEQIIAAVNSKLKNFGMTEYQIQFETYYGCVGDYVANKEAFEHLVNDAVNMKNQYKAAHKNVDVNKKEQMLTDEDKQQDLLVEKILNQNLFKYHYQPIVSAVDGTIFAYEALMRADVPEKLSPGQILESAERLDRLYDIEKYTFFNVLRYVKEHPEYFEDKKVFVNSMPNYMLKGEDAKELLRLMKSLRGKIVVEFTESSEINDDVLERFKDDLASVGTEYAIDDYGSGYSNVNNLLRYMPHYVKIDRQLLTGIESDSHKQHFVKDIIEFTTDNDIVALAEGIENVQELRTVITLGANLIQGYYTAKPSEEVVPDIAEQVRYEIIQRNRSLRITDNNRIMYLEYDSDVHLIKCTTDNYTKLVVKANNGEDRKYKITGAPGFQSDITVAIEDGFSGTLVLHNASLAGDKNVPCIELGKDVDLFLVLVGSNECRTAGIKVPESSHLTIMGDGDLAITTRGSRCFGIGNDMKSAHGVIDFKQDGIIAIDANGMYSVGIGSGLGGTTKIGRGRYELTLNGQHGVAIGQIEGDANLYIHECDMDITYDVTFGTAIGSVNGATDLRIENTSLVLRGSGNRFVGYGSLDGESVKISMDRVHTELDLKGMQCMGIGTYGGSTDAVFKNTSIGITAQGAKSIAIGCEDGQGSMYCDDTDVSIKIKNSTGRDITIPEDSITFNNGRCEFVVNNEVKKRNIDDKYIV